MWPLNSCCRVIVSASDTIVRWYNYVFAPDPCCDDTLVPWKPQYTFCLLSSLNLVKFWAVMHFSCREGQWELHVQRYILPPPTPSPPKKRQKFGHGCWNVFSHALCTEVCHSPFHLHSTSRWHLQMSFFTILNVLSLGHDSSKSPDFLQHTWKLVLFLNII